MTLPPHVLAEAQRIMDAAARRILEEELAEQAGENETPERGGGEEVE